ncbi:MAG: acyl-CoA thioesterase [Phycisphaerae bacterium]|nr:acyl-CoA thioesterase [Phycisphaerae bacterium]
MIHEFKITRRVAFSETDMVGIVHFSNFFRYVEEVEQAMFRSLGLSIVTRIDDRHYGWPRVKASCEYLQPLRFEDEFEIHLLIREVGTKSITYDFVLYPVGDTAEQAVARGSMTTVCVVRDEAGNMTSTPIPAELAAQIQAGPADG